VIDIVQESPETIFLAEDEAGLYLQATMMAVWAPRGQTPVIRAHPGREKVNFYGTLNLHTGQVRAMRSTEMNAKATARHLEQVLRGTLVKRYVMFWQRILACS
jgi:hypothetical protein